MIRFKIGGPKIEGLSFQLKTLSFFQGIKPGALYMLYECSPTEPLTQPSRVLTEIVKGVGGREGEDQQEELGFPPLKLWFAGINKLT